VQFPQKTFLDAAVETGFFPERAGEEKVENFCFLRHGWESLADRIFFYFFYFFGESAPRRVFRK